MSYRRIMDFYHPRWPVFGEDNHLLVVYKPAGLMVQGDHKGRANLLDMAKQWLKLRYAKPGNVFVGLVHRLDGPVAGVVVLARTSKAAARLSAQFREGRIEKHYLAVVDGRPEAPAARLVHWLSRDGRLSRVVAEGVEGSRKASLQYRLLSREGRLSLLAVKLESGRRHQIRAQLAAIGCPILGDRRYGAERGLAHGRIALLARRLAFDHPTQARRLEFLCPLPRGWPMAGRTSGSSEPYWTIDDYRQNGLRLAPDSG